MAKQQPPDINQDERNEVLVDALKEQESLRGQLEDQTALKGQMEELLKSNRDLQEQVKDQHDRQSRIEQVMAGGAAKQIDDMDAPTILRAQIDEFLASTRPDTEFFSIPLPGGMGQFRQIVLAADEEIHLPDLHKTKRTPDLWLRFALWAGPGSDLFNPISGLPEKFGQADIIKLKQVKITEEDIENFHLGPNIEPRDGRFEVFYCIRRVLDSKLFKGTKRKIVTGEMFRRMIQSRYESLWDQIRRDKELDDAMERIGLGQAKTGAGLASLVTS